MPQPKPNATVEDQRAKVEAILEEIGEPPLLPIVPWSTPGTYKPHPRVSVRGLEAMLIGGLLEPELLHTLGKVVVAPFVEVEASLLSWHPAHKKLVYLTPNGSYVIME